MNAGNFLIGKKMDEMWQQMKQKSWKKARDNLYFKGDKEEFEGNRLILLLPGKGNNNQCFSIYCENTQYLISYLENCV